MLKLMSGRFDGTVKIVRSVNDSTVLGLNSKRGVFSMFDKGIKYWGVRDHEQFEIRPIKDQRFRI